MAYVTRLFISNRSRQPRHNLAGTKLPKQAMQIDTGPFRKRAQWPICKYLRMSPLQAHTPLVTTFYIQRIFVLHSAMYVPSPKPDTITILRFPALLHEYLTCISKKCTNLNQVSRHTNENDGNGSLPSGAQPPRKLPDHRDTLSSHPPPPHPVSHPRRSEDHPILTRTHMGISVFCCRDEGNRDD